jgi:hypothetical protein
MSVISEIRYVMARYNEGLLYFTEPSFYTRSMWVNFSSIWKWYQPMQFLGPAENGM